MLSVDLPTEADTLALGRSLSAMAEGGDVITLSGALGVGKTVLARGFLQDRVSAEEEVTSPTYTLVHVYDSNDPPLWHFDLYRLEDSDEVQELGLDQALADGISLIEWPDRAADWLPPTRLDITLTVRDDSNTRFATFSGDANWLERISALPQFREGHNDS